MVSLHSSLEDLYFHPTILLISVPRTCYIWGSSHPCSKTRPEITPQLPQSFCAVPLPLPNRNVAASFIQTLSLDVVAQESFGGVKLLRGLGVTLMAF
jgi:hypothetical protein